MFTPSRFVAAEDWGTLRALRRRLLQTEPSDRVVGLIPTHARMLNASVVSQFLTELEPLAHMPLGFVFAGDREALAKSNRVTGLWLESASVRGCAGPQRLGTRTPASPAAVSRAVFIWTC
ncbi:Uncharacterised protein [Mycobacteroides abscessus subsp. massiliense]|nr:Uncharacterised protein [Mycobacteroides abscessus subsp. massiliense]